LLTSECILNNNLVYFPFFFVALGRYSEVRVERYVGTYLPIKRKKLNAEDLLGGR
jgi:hypothetical protein